MLRRCLVTNISWKTPLPPAQFADGPLGQLHRRLWRKKLPGLSRAAPIATDRHLQNRHQRLAGRLRSPIFCNCPANASATAKRPGSSSRGRKLKPHHLLHRFMGLRYPHLPFMENFNLAPVAKVANLGAQCVDLNLLPSSLLQNPDP